MLEPKTGVYANDVLISADYRTLELQLNGVQASKFGDTGNQNLVDTVKTQLGINVSASDLSLTTSYASGTDILSLLLAEIKKAEHKKAVLQLIRIFWTELSDDSTLIAEFRKQINASTNKLFLKTSPNGVSQSGNNITYSFDPVLITLGLGATIDMPVEADGLANYQQMIRDFVYMVTNGGINIDTDFGTGNWDWISAAFLPNDTNPTSYNVTFTADTNDRQLITDRIGDICQAGVPNMPYELKSAGAVLAV